MITDTELLSFNIIRKKLLSPFMQSLDEVRRRFPATWRSRKSRQALEVATLNYFKIFFATKQIRITRKQDLQTALRNRSWY
jgi:predicted lipoprotein